MGGKFEQSEKRKAKPPAPSTGFGADSAFDEMIKRRVAPPSSHQKPAAQGAAARKR